MDFFWVLCVCVHLSEREDEGMCVIVFNHQCEHDYPKRCLKSYIPVFRDPLILKSRAG